MKQLPLKPPVPAQAIAPPSSRTTGDGGGGLVSPQTYSGSMITVTQTTESCVRLT